MQNHNMMEEGVYLMQPCCNFSPRNFGIFRKLLVGFGRYGLVFTAGKNHTYANLQLYIIIMYLSTFRYRKGSWQYHDTFVWS